MIVKNGKDGPTADADGPSFRWAPMPLRCYSNGPEAEVRGPSFPFAVPFEGVLGTRTDESGVCRPREKAIARADNYFEKDRSQKLCRL